MLAARTHAHTAVCDRTAHSRRHPISAIASPSTARRDPPAPRTNQSLAFSLLSCPARCHAFGGHVHFTCLPQPVLRPFLAGNSRSHHAREHPSTDACSAAVRIPPNKLVVRATGLAAPRSSRSMCGRRARTRRNHQSSAAVNPPIARRPRPRAHLSAASCAGAVASSARASASAIASSPTRSSTAIGASSAPSPAAAAPSPAPPPAPSPAPPLA